MSFAVEAAHDDTSSLKKFYRGLVIRVINSVVNGTSVDNRFRISGSHAITVLLVFWNFEYRVVNQEQELLYREQLLVL